MPATPAQLLIARIRQMGFQLPGDGDYRLDRTYAGRYQRKAGAWAWFLVPPEDAPQRHALLNILGSQWPITALVAAAGIEISYNKYTRTWDADPGSADVLRNRHGDIVQTIDPLND